MDLSRLAKEARGGEESENLVCGRDALCRFVFFRVVLKSW